MIVVALIVALPAVLWLTRSLNHWHHPLLLGGVGVLSLCCTFGELRLKRSAYYSVDDAFTLLALLIGGPLPAFLVYLIPDLIARVGFRRLPAWSAGAWATYSSYGWCTLAAAGVLSLGQVHSMNPSGLPTMAAAGIVLVFVNWLIASALFATLWKRMRPGPLLREEYLATLPTQVSVLTITLTVAMLIPLGGSASLIPLSTIVLIPQLLLPWIARSRDVTRLSLDEATQVYARALLSHLGARRAERRLTLAAARLAPATPNPGRTGIRLPAPALGLPIGGGAESDSWRIALHVPESWDGAGNPAGLGGRMIPKESRLLAVATAWASLTAADGPGMPQTEAILALEAQAGTRFDPRIVAAASEIVTTEAQFADISTFQPRLDLLPVPTVIRSELLPWALKHAVA